VADGVYDEIKDTRERLLQADRDKTWDEIQRQYYGINRKGLSGSSTIARGVYKIGLLFHRANYSQSTE
jgi:hypothetical protein